MRKLTVNGIQERLPSFIKIVGETYVTNKVKATFVDEEFGEWAALPCNVLAGSVHPDRSNRQIIETNLKRYGHKNPLSSKEVQEKIRQTNIKKHGVEFPTQSRKVREKVKSTMRSRYGVEHNRQIKGAVEAFRETMRERHGVMNPGQMKTTKMAVELDRQKNPDKYFHSEPELEIRDFIALLGLRVVVKFIRGDARSFELDIYCEEKKIAIEYNGCYWHSEENRQMYPQYHLEKLEACLKREINLVQVFEHEWRDRRPQVESFLRSLLGKNRLKVGARQTVVRPVTYQESREFLNRYHISGSAYGDLYLGVFFRDEMIAVAVFGSHHRNYEDKVLRRWGVKTDWNISGAISKVAREAMRRLDVNHLITWCDRRWSQGIGFVAAGWKVDRTLKPDYFYWNGSGKYFVSKQSRRKRAVNTPDNITEHEHAKADGLYRIYDCGKIRLIYSDN